LSVDAVLQRAEALAGEGHLDEAVNVWRSVVEKAPANRTARERLSRYEPVVTEIAQHIAAARLAESEGRRQEAATWWHRVLGLNHRHAEALDGYARTSTGTVRRLIGKLFGRSS
jgi:hypothetical protein